MVTVKVLVLLEFRASVRWVNVVWLASRELRNAWGSTLNGDLLPCVNFVVCLMMPPVQTWQLTPCGTTMPSYLNSFAPERCGSNITNAYLKPILWTDFLTIFTFKLVPGESHRTPWMIIQHWFGWWLDALRQNYLRQCLPRYISLFGITRQQ